MKYKLLLVDDEATNLKLLREILKDEYELAYAKEGYSALELAAQSPDLILLDVMMPKMDGYEACRQLKANSKTKNIPVIFVTAKSDVLDELKGFELGAVDYITKPISPPIVNARIKTHLSMRAAYLKLEIQNQALLEAEQLKKDIDLITRHDLKAPLNGIIGFTDLLLFDNTVQDAHKELITIVQNQGYRLLDMINLSLGLFKMEQGTYQLETTKVDILLVLNRILKDVVVLMRSKRHVEILIDDRSVEQSEKFFILGEELLCYSMLSNLIKNALEAISSGSSVTIRLRKVAEMATVDIHNPGMVPEAVQACFFDKFVTSGKRSGTGLGTYSAKLIAETQGGTIHMNTSETEGTHVIVSMPCPV